MPKRVFTETWLRSLLKSPPRRRTDYTEPGRKGFQLRHWPGGALTFVLRYFRDGREVPMTLGSYPAMSLEEAHEAHADARRLLGRGLDPISERDAAARARKAHERQAKASDAITIRNVIAEWGWHYARRHRKHPREAIRLARVNLGDRWAGRPARELTKRDAVLLLDRIVARGSGVMARRVRSLGLQIFTFAVSRDLVTVNPFVGTTPPGDEETPRERKLTPDEVRTFWKALDSDEIEMSRPVRLALRLILVTAQRPGEVAGAAWAEFDGALWTIPPERSKNSRAHEVPLTSLALEMVDELRELAKGRPHLLPSVHSKLKHDEPLSVRALSRALRNNLDDATGKLLGCQPFTPHDLRRTAASMMTSLGITRLHVSKVLNHTDQDVTGAVYDRHDYFAEKKQALERWATNLRAIIAGKKTKIVPIRSGRAA